MRILLTGANGYIGMRLLPKLLDDGHEVICAVRNKVRFTSNEELIEKVEIVELDFFKRHGSSRENQEYRRCLLPHPFHVCFH